MSAKGLRIEKSLSPLNLLSLLLQLLFLHLSLLPILVSNPSHNSPICFIPGFLDFLGLLFLPSKLFLNLFLSLLNKRPL